MDKQITGAEIVGKFLGSIVIASFIVVAFSLILRMSWNCCVPQVFGGNEITLQQSLSMLGLAWTASAMTRVRV